MGSLRVPRRGLHPERAGPARGPALHGGDGRANRGPSLQQPQVVGVAAATAAGKEHGISLEGFAGARLVVSDVRVALLLLDEARQRALQRLVGVPRDQSWLVTLIALALVAQAAHEKADQVVRGPGGLTRSDVALGAAGVRELLAWISGRSSRDAPLVGTLVMIAVARTLVGFRAAPNGARHQSILT